MHNARPKSLFFSNMGFRIWRQCSLSGCIQNSFSLMRSATGLINRVADRYAVLRDEDFICVLILCGQNLNCPPILWVGEQIILQLHQVFSQLIELRLC
jgi:hypothetical protein